ncbi:MAG: TraB/GumN family protein [gamma proteobacterium symbiont of Bathyaustriella thionipta]|nr:TraB/GumN family protein [gamma proteobacterium symbiont of Bathyaustriella thionipta]
MNSLQRSCYILLCLYFVLSAVAAQAMPFPQGRLFSVQSPQGQLSYVFGTMHSEAPEVIELPAAIQQKFAQSSTLALELEMTPEVILRAFTAMMLTDGRQLSDIIGARLYQQLVPLMQTQGLSEMMLSRMKPWGVFALLSAPKQKNGLFLDIRLYQQAQLEGKSTFSLETVEEQLDVFDRLSDADQIRLLRQAVAQFDDRKRQFAELQQRYLAGDLAGLMQMNDESMQGIEKALVDRVMDSLLLQRNRRMAERLQPLLNQGGVFVAIGALHLPGENGLLQLLKEQGYQVEKAY